MIAGSLVALIWMILRMPFGIHGFIPGILVGLVLIVVVSLFTKKLPQRHIKQIWEE